jgi:2-C-methyl-D-erythritol 2,4-cyclodiphosphate synthase
MTRIGFGYDVHKLVTGRKLILGGVEIPSEKGLLGHSDADVLLHAICDALLGAAALGDIGHHFPDTDERYRGISSLALLTFVGDLLRAKNMSINNIDSTVILQMPKIASHMPAMIHNIAEALKIDTANISVKATTNEGLGFEGRSDGAAAHAVASLETTL